jgi:hypothetical protein
LLIPLLFAPKSWYDTVCESTPGELGVKRSHWFRRGVTWEREGQQKSGEVTRTKNEEDACDMEADGKIRFYLHGWTGDRVI